MRKGFFILTLSALILFLFLIPITYSAGVCQLDKVNYIKGETALFSCTCTKNNEEGVAGDMIWRNSSNDIFQNTTSNSLACKTSFFTDIYTFTETTNFTGNVTFDTASGNWGNADDIVFDNFNYNGSGFGLTSCIIIPQGNIIPVILGEIFSVKIAVQDPVALDPLIGVFCNLHVIDINRNPVFSSPQALESQNSFPAFRTTSDGQVSFHHKMNEKLWTINTTYILHTHCVCLNDSDNNCFYESNGDNAGFRSCTADIVFNTSLTDKRGDNIEAIAGVDRMIYLMFILGTLLFIGFYFYKTSPPIKFTLLVFSILFFMVALNITSISLQNSSLSNIIIDFFDLFSSIIWYGYWFLAGILIVIWSLTFLNELLMRKTMRNIKKYGDGNG